jgi:hypothetical protein
MSCDWLGENLSITDQEKLASKPEWQLACQVAASKGLGKSELLPRFLLYVCEHYLLGSEHEITEQRIGIRIFNRPSDYNPGEDNIVRSYARLLRKRLDVYFDNEGSDATMRISVPRGGYLPCFHNNVPAPVTTTTDPQLLSADEALPLVSGEETQEATSAVVGESPEGWDTVAHTSRRSPWLPAVVGMVVGILLSSSAWLTVHAIRAEREQSPAHILWGQLFQQNQNTLIVPADSGLGILQNLTRHLVSVEEYANGSFLSDMQRVPGLDTGNFNDLRSQRYTSVVDLDIASKLMQLPEFIAERTQIRYARNISLADIENSNVILLGSKHTNPWVSLFENRLNFKLEYASDVDDSYVINNRPVGGEQKIYRNSADSMSNNHTYGAIAYLPDLNGTGHVLIIQGLNMAATQAAAFILFDPSVMQQVLQQAALPGGTVRPFELLVETTSIGAAAPGARLIGTRIYPQ